MDNHIKLVLILLLPINIQSQTTYIFCPGMHAGLEQVAKYCSHFEVNNLFTIHTPHHITVIDGHLTTAVTFSETVSSKKAPKLLSFDVWYPSYLLAVIYNIVSTMRNAQNNRQEKISIEYHKHKKEWPTPHIDLRNIHFGQAEDIKTIAHSYDTHTKRYPDDHTVLYGVSRGAAAALNFLKTAYHRQTQNISAVILQGCFDSTKNVLLNNFGSKLYPIIHKIFSILYSAHDVNGLQPIDHIELLPQIPILLITSKKDSVVPAQCTWNLYHALKKAGHDVYILELQHSSHARYMMDNAEDKARYECVVHAFYKKHGLAHDHRLAKEGTDLLELCKP